MAAVRLPSSTPDRDASRSRSKVTDAAEAVPIDRVPPCIAGFFTAESAAQMTAQQLQRVQGLLPSQLTLAGPADASRFRFGRVARQWKPRSAAGDSVGKVWTAAVPGGMLAGAAVAAWLVLDVDLAAQEHALLATLAVLAGAATGAGVSRLLRRASQPGRFDRVVRRQLAAGRWALVVSGVPWAQQAGVLSLVRASSLKWCAMAPAPYRL
jgi:hypothetical protein